MAQAMSAGGGGAGQLGDTRLTKVFVGGLAWETSREGVRGYFEQFGEILEAVVIADKSTGRSKGYGFVTFREPEAAMGACFDPYPVIDGRRANCNLAYLGVQRSKAAAPPYVTNNYVYGGSNVRATKAAADYFVPDHGIQQGIPAAYNVHGYSPYLSDYSYQPLSTYYQAYGGLAGGAQYQVFNGGAATAAVAATMADPAAGLYPYYQYVPASGAAAGYSMMQYPQMYHYTAAAGLLQQYGGAVAPLNPDSSGQAAGMIMSTLTAPTLPAPTPQYHYRLISSHLPAAAPDQKKPLA